MLFCRHLFQSAQQIYEKREGSGAGPVVPLTNRSGCGRPKNVRIWFRILNTARDTSGNYGTGCD
jgi:hypothetical protein